MSRAYSSQGCILVIDDSRTVREILRVGLSRAGFDVTCYLDGIAALSALYTPDCPLPDLIILDITLPKIDGYELAMKFRKMPSLARTPIVMLSGSASVLDRLKGRLAGANVYLTKPFRIQQVVEVAQTQLAFRVCAIPQ